MNRSAAAGSDPLFTGATGITTSSPLLDAGKKKWVGVAANSVNNNGAGLTTFHGQSVGPNDLLIGYTFAGDSNMDGSVNFGDFLLLQGGFSNTVGGKLWQEGDFNYDGFSNFSDFLLLQGNFNTVGATDVAGFTPTQQQKIMSDFAVTAVPEPTALGLIGLAGGALMRRRRRQA